MISLSGKTAGEWSKIMNAIKHVSQYATAKVEHSPNELEIWAMSFMQTDFLKVRICDAEIEGEGEKVFCLDAEALYRYFKKYPQREKLIIEVDNNIKITGDKLTFTTPLIEGYPPSVDAEKQIKLPWNIKFSVDKLVWSKFLNVPKTYRVSIYSRPEDEGISIVSYLDQMNDSDYLELYISSKEILKKNEFTKISFDPNILRKTIYAPVEVLNFFLCEEDKAVKITGGEEYKCEIIYFIAPTLEE